MTAYVRPTIIGLMRVKNEARWIARVVRSISVVCDAIIVLDDHSDDDTPDICEALGADVERSTFDGLDESRDKDRLLQLAYAHPAFRTGRSWALMIDGDEEICAPDAHMIRKLADAKCLVASLRILYLWDNADTVRTDGVYARFSRPSLFQLRDPNHRFKRTANGGSANFHCSSVPKEMLTAPVAKTDVRLLHFGYMHREDRLRKYAWYTKLDPNNRAEDEYKHMVIGDVFAADSRFKYGGPLRLEPLARFL